MNQSSTPEPALEARDLSACLGGQEVLNIPSLGVERGEVLVVVGPNGSGKTTLLLSMALLHIPARGSILYRGKPVSYGAEALKLRRRFAVVFQEPMLLSGTVWDNVTLGLRLRHTPEQEIAANAQKWLERYGIAHLAKRQAKLLSGGEAKRVSLARAFVLEPEVLFLDEPFAALDTPTHQNLVEEFQSVLHETRVSTVMVTHETEEALILADRVAVVMNGRVRQTGTAQEVFSAPADEEVASFIKGGDILRGEVASQDGGLAGIRVGEQVIEAVSELGAGTQVSAFLRYDDITLSNAPAQPMTSSARNQLGGSVTRIFPLGPQVRVTLDCSFPLSVLITRRSYEGMKLTIGSPVNASFKSSAVRILKR